MRECNHQLTRNMEQLPDREIMPGTMHPCTLLCDHILDFFAGLGYSTTDGPEVEAEWFNFDVLNMTGAHFARALDHTFYIEHPEQPGERSGLVMRAHASPIQARAMLCNSLPMYKVAIGRTYRADSLDATHSPVFNQLEGLAVDKGLTMADLQRMLDRFASAMFGDNIVTRMRPYQFAHAEPAAEIDVQCHVCKGRATECRTCHGEGWIEWGGCGMVHPNVLENCGIDPLTYSAFSFGIGVERTLMLRAGVDDIGHIVNGDIGFALIAQEVLSDRICPRRTLAALGCIEITSFPFTDSNINDALRLPPDDLRRQQLSLLNPLEGQGRNLRTSLVPGLLKAVQSNSKYGLENLLLFEEGRVFPRNSIHKKVPRPSTGSRPADSLLSAIEAAIPPQPRYVAALGFGCADWTCAINATGEIIRRAYHTQPAQYAPWLPEKSAEIHVGKTLVGYAGELDPEVLKNFGLPAGLCALEINLSALPPLS